MRNVQDLITLKLFERHGFALKEPLSKRDLMVLRQMYLAVILIISWGSIEIEHFLLKLWVKHTYTWVASDIVLLLFTIGIGVFLIVVAIAEAIMFVVTPINRVMDKICGQMDNYAKKVASAFPAHIRIPLLIYYFFTFDLDRLIALEKKPRKS